MITLSSTQIRFLRSPLGISIIAHLTVLLIFALIVITPEKPVVWQDFEWISNLIEDVPQIAENTDESPSSASANLSSQASTTEVTAPQNQAQPSPAPNLIQPKRQVIDAPGELADPSVSTTPKVSSNLGSRGSVNRSGALAGKGPGGSSGKLEGSGIRASKEVLPDLRVSDYGEVRLSFQVNRAGTVLPNSITVVKSATSAQNQSAVEALKQWEFVVAPGNSPDQVYSILFIFNPGN